MSFLDYLKEHRGDFIDHRFAEIVPKTNNTFSDSENESTTNSSPSSGGLLRRRKIQGSSPPIRFRQLRPAYTPLPYSDPLPYEEPWERAFR